jgi:septal ring factor EnvC (AmiA/AmiB activator)
MSRLAVCAVLFAASCLFVTQRAEPVAAQDKKDKKDNVAALEKQINMLEKQVAALRQDNARDERQLAALKGDVAALKVANARLQTENNRLEALLKKERSGDAKDDKTIKELQTTIDGYRGAGLVHVVILKLKSDSPSTEAQSVIDETYSQLSKIKTVRGVWAGRPVAKTKATPDAAADYTVALVFVFDDAAGLKTYLNDPVHTKFTDKHLKKWETPVVYDFEPKKAAP